MLIAKGKINLKIDFIFMQDPLVGIKQFNHQISSTIITGKLGWSLQQQKTLKFINFKNSMKVRSTNTKSMQKLLNKIFPHLIQFLHYTTRNIKIKWKN